MIYRLPKWQRQSLAVALLAALIGLGWMLAVQPVTARLAELADEIQAERTLAGRLAAAANGASPGRLEAQPEATRRSGFFIDGRTEPIRLAALQTELSAILDANGVKPRSSRAIVAREYDGLRLLGAELQFVADIGALQKILVDLERHRPAIFIERLQLSASPQPAGTDRDEPGLLDVRLEVYAAELRAGGE